MPPLSKVELYAAIRRDARAGLSGRALERKYHVGRPTVVKAMASARPPPRKQPPPRSSKLDPFKPVIDEIERELGRGRGAFARVAQQLGLHPEVLRNWVRAVEKGQRPSGERVAGSEAEKDARIKELERENRELRRANDILKAASAFCSGDESSTATVTRFVDEHRSEFRVEPICTVIEFAVSLREDVDSNAEPDSD